MISGIPLANSMMGAAGLAFSFACLLLSIISHVPERRTRRFLVLFFSVMTLYIVCNLLGVIAEFSASVVFSQLSLFFESLFSSILMPLLVWYLLQCCKEPWQKNRLLAIVFALWVGYAALLIYTQFTREIYYFSPDNVYHRGPYYPVLLVPPVLIMLTTLVGVVRRRKQLTKKQFSAFLIYLLLPTAAMLLQMWFYGLFLIVSATALSALFMLAFFLTDYMESYIRQKEEIAEQRASIMVLQMRPHFIYNTLSSIYYLIRQDQTKAQQVTRDFMTYLRKNFSAIAKENTIPFTEELEHARAYLAVEKARFEEKLFVEWDTPHTHFRVPTLTLQPIVENAVKHGIGPQLDPLHITVTTRRTDKGSFLTVEDSGKGFTPEDPNEPHIALSNLRERLQMMCNGTLDIHPGETGGTVVTVFIPADSVGEEEQTLSR